MSNPYTFHIGNLMVIIYASTRDEATRIFSESLKEHDKQIRAEAEQEHAKICESCIHKVSKEDIDAIRADAIEDYTEWLRKAHANFDEDYAEDIKSDYLEQLKEQSIK